MAKAERVVEPQAVVAAAGADAEEARLAVYVEVVEAAVGEGLETDGLAGGRGGGVGSGRAGRSKSRVASEVVCVGRGRWRERGQGRGSPEEGLAAAEVGGRRVRILGKVSTKGLED